MSMHEQIVRHFHIWKNNIGILVVICGLLCIAITHSLLISIPCIVIVLGLIMHVYDRHAQIAKIDKLVEQAHLRATKAYKDNIPTIVKYNRRNQ